METTRWGLQPCMAVGGGDGMGVLAMSSVKRLGQLLVASGMISFISKSSKLSTCIPPIPFLWLNSTCSSAWCPLGPLPHVPHSHTALGT